MPDLVLRDASGDPQTYPDVETVEIPTTEDGVTAVFTAGEVLDGVEIALDFSGGDQTVSVPDGYLVKQAVVKMPETLLPNNIAEGEVIAGVVGTVSRGKIPDDEKAIKFYDPYGNIFCAYTRAEIQELTELPAGPALAGVTFEKWTHTLEELKETLYYADVGPMYQYGGKPATILIVEASSIKIQFGNISSSQTVHWGDGDSSGVNSTSSFYGTSVSHTYDASGEYVIAIVTTSTTGYPCKLGATGNGSYIYGVSGNQTNDSSGITQPTGFPYSIKSILAGSNDYYSSKVELRCVLAEQKLRFISANGINANRSKQFAWNNALKVIAGKMNNIFYDYAFYCCNSLKRVQIDGTSYATALTGCADLEEVEYYGTYISKITNMNVQWAMLMTQETPPTITATAPVWGTKPIYVPDTAVDAYKAADGWSTVAEYIVPASTYRQ